MPRPDVLVFDVNETLLDLAALRPRFEEVLGTTEAIGEWFARMLHGSLVANHLGRYRTFEVLGVEALEVTAIRRGIELAEGAAVSVVSAMRSLPAHPDVPPALERLRSAGFRLATLTNGSTEVLADQLTDAGIAELFDRALSVDEVQRFKPAPEVYLMAAAKLGAELDDLTMVAAHDWDVLGAQSVGIRGAFVARPGSVWGPQDRKPDLTGPDVGSIADQLLT